MGDHFGAQASCLRFASILLAKINKPRPPSRSGYCPATNLADYREARHHSQIEVSRAGDAALYFDGTRVMKKEKISELTTNRLSVYLRCLNELAAAGIKTVSSQDLAEQFNLNSAQIRKDLGYFGEFGVRGTGYFIKDLRRHLTKILGLDQPHRVGIIGAGRLGTALANYNGLSKSNFSVVALFDNDPEKVGENVGADGIPVHDVKHLAKMVRDEGIDVAVIAVPARAAQKVLNQIMAAGVKAILNFAPAPLTSRLGVKVKTVDLTTSLESLSYFLAQPGTARVTNSARTNDANSAHKRQTHEI
ncbi:MAG: redox-sensing transcriptional repressor Rex [Acidobacteriota bacterium]